MALMKIERLDHLGVVGGVIKDLSLIELIDARIPPSDREEITTGQAIAAMILNGLGFSNRPISLTPQFFENKPVELLFGTGVMADHFNRFKLKFDHLGVVGGVIKDLSLIELIDARIPPSDREEITTGQAIAAMILNGLGFSNRPISLTPQFFENKPVELLFGTGVMADHFNRFKLGRSLDKVFAYGCDLLFSEIALSVCGQEGIACQFNCLDTTSFSLYGDYVPETDEQAIAISHGYRLFVSFWCDGRPFQPLQTGS